MLCKERLSLQWTVTVNVTQDKDAWSPLVGANKMKRVDLKKKEFVLISSRNIEMGMGER